jgi:hypothetical protein
MKIRNNKFIGLSMAAVLALVLTTACSQAKTTEGVAQTNNSAASTETVAMVNAKPEVVWEAAVEDNPVGKAYNTSFKIPNSYYLSNQTPSSGQLPLGLKISFPNLKPLTLYKKKCRDFRPSVSRECLSDVIEIIFGHNLNRQDFKDDGINEVNYLNYYFDKSRPENYNRDTNTLYKKSSEKFYGLDHHTRSGIVNKKDSSGQEIQVVAYYDDRYFDLSDTGDVKTVITCPNKTTTDESIIKNGSMPTCLHSFILKKYKMELGIRYDRKYLTQWLQIQDSVTSIINQFNQAAMAKQGEK